MDTQKFYTLLAIPSRAEAAQVADLKSLTAHYPWFAVAHQLLMEVTFRNQGELLNEYATKAAAYSADRSYFYWRLQQPTAGETVAAADFELIEDDSVVARKEECRPTSADKQESTTKPKYIMAGGEYFTSDDFVSVASTDDDPLSQFIVAKPKFDPNVSLLNSISIDQLPKAAPEQRSITMDYVTETLAQIYLNQQLYDLAITTYDKLILQNPEKSTYFATQIKEIKKHK